MHILPNPRAICMVEFESFFCRILILISCTAVVGGALDEFGHAGVSTAWLRVELVCLVRV